MPNIRRPGVEVIQEFQQLLPAFGLPTLPELIIGEAYQVLTKDPVGNYLGSAMSYLYSSVLPGTIVDIDLTSDYPVRIFIEGGRIVFIPTRAVGITTINSRVFQDTTTTNAFQGVLVGDKLKILSGADAGEYTVTALDPTDYSKITINAELTTTATAIEYKIERAFTSIEIPVSTTGVVVDEDSVDLPDGLQSEGSDIVSGVVKLSYRALRPQFYNAVGVYRSFSDLEAVFGIGQVVPENPLAFGLSLALQNADIAVGGLGLDATAMTDITQAHQKALDKAKEVKINGEYAYSLVPLSQEPVVHQLYDVHVEQLSMPEKKKERIAFINRKLVSVTTIKDESTTNGEYLMTTIRSTGIVVISPSPLATHFKDTVTTNAFADIMVGDIIRISAGGADDGDHVVASKIDNTEIVLEDTLTIPGTTIPYRIVRKDGQWTNSVVFYDSNANFLEDGVEAGHYLEVFESVGNGTFSGRYEIAEVSSAKKLKLAVAISGGPFTSVRYEINRNFTRDEEASYIAAYAHAFANRRLVMSWSDIAEIPVAGSTRDLPGYYFNCALGAMVAGLPPHQGFTNLTIAGFIGLKNSGDRFTQDQLDVIANGGVLILDQDVPEAPLYVRHQLTTDTSAIAYQELSITKNIDSISKLIRSTYQPYIGIYNINDALIEMLKTIGTALIEFLKKSKLPRIGAPLREGAIISMVESSTAPDTIESEWDISVPYPFNNLKITLLI